MTIALGGVAEGAGLLGAGIVLAIIGGVLASGPEVEGGSEGGNGTSILFAALVGIGPIAA